MNNCIFSVSSYFDGESVHQNGPYIIATENSKITEIISDPLTTDRTELSQRFRDLSIPVINAEFLMPGMVEAHCHLFLNGGELDFQARKDYFVQPEEAMLQTARDNLRDSVANGITLIRDAGDRYGINHKIRDEFVDSHVKIRSPGQALRRPKKYGSFMATEVESPEEMRAAVVKAYKAADDLKIILTGIIDFVAGTVTKPPQFDLESLNELMDMAHEHNMLTFTHCSGIEGLKIAAEAGVDSIEHGFFMTREVLELMAQKGIAWVPTFSPVHFQWHRPELAGWDESTVANLKAILDSHSEHLAIGHDLNVNIVAGSDAGSYGVRHGYALIDELLFMVDAGMPIAAVLASATSVPRELWSEQTANIQVGNSANFVALKTSPFEQAESLRQVEFVFNNGCMLKKGVEVTITSDTMAADDSTSCS